MVRAGMEKINKQHTAISERRIRFRKWSYLLASQSAFGERWRKFATAAATRWSFQQEAKRLKRRG
jgi:hypothetical protein